MALTDRSYALIVVNSVFPFLAILATALRFYARKLKGLAPMSDDYMIVISVIFMLGNCIPFIYAATNGGMGQRIDDLSPDELLVFGKVTFWTQFPYIWAVVCFKISILLLYRRIFTTSKFRIAANVIGGVIILWMIAFFFASLFQAWPISYNWDPDQPGSTINEEQMYLALAATELVLDVAVLVLPWTVIWSLQMSTSRKWMVIGIFMLGGFVCVSGALRVYYFVTVQLDPNLDFTYDTYNVFIWTSIEPCVGIVCACLPTLGPLFTAGHGAESMLGSFKNYMRLRTQSNRSKRTGGGSAGSSQQKGSKVMMMGDDSMTKSLYQMPGDAVIMTSINGQGTEVVRDRKGPEGILVESTISRSQDRPAWETPHAK